MQTLNLGILAHVDAGKTTLTERLLHRAGIVDEVGSVDRGTTHTDSLDLERTRGITIKAAVVSFVVGDVRVNLIDTPGHPDFIAEVERALAVLDGGVLVISAVEGVQAQTRVLLRTLKRLGIPCVLFVNKIDRVGAREGDLLDDIRQRLTPSIVAMGTTSGLGSRDAAFVPHAVDRLDLTPLGEHDDNVLGALVADQPPSAEWLGRVLAGQARDGTVHPVFFGSALTGVGVPELTAGITTCLPSATGDADGPLSGTVFKIDRGPAGDRIAFVRLFSGTVRVRDRIDDRTVTAIEVFDRGTTVTRRHASAGDIAKIWGLGDVRIGDAVGKPHPRGELHFPPPTLATVADARPEDRPRLFTALTQLGEQDPLIGVRYDESRRELHLSLYGEVQKEVIQATLLTDYGVEATFRETTPICIERLKGSGRAIETMPPGRSSPRPFLAGIGLRVDPAPIGSGVTVETVSQYGRLPAAFMTAIVDSIHEGLQQGIHGWEVTDCVVTLTDSQYAPRQSHAHQKFSKAMSSIGSDFRYLTPLVLMAALKRAGTVVCEPVLRYELEVPADVLPVMIPTLARLEAPPLDQTGHGSALVLTGHVRAPLVHALQQQIPDLTRGEGVLEYDLDSYQPARGAPPTRPRTDNNPLNRDEYLMRVLGVV